MGPAENGKVAMRFAGNNLDVGVKTSDLCMEKPSDEFAGVHRIDDVVYISGPNKGVGNDQILFHGTEGAVIGPSGDDKVAVKFSGLGIVRCLVAELSRTKPGDLAGGFGLNDTVFF